MEALFASQEALDVAHSLRRFPAQLPLRPRGNASESRVTTMPANLRRAALRLTTASGLASPSLGTLAATGRGGPASSSTNADVDRSILGRRGALTRVDYRRLVRGLPQEVLARKTTRGATGPLPVAAAVTVPHPLHPLPSTPRRTTPRPSPASMTLPSWRASPSAS